MSASSVIQESDVDAVYEQLRDKHKSYDEESLRMWAHLSKWARTPH